MASTLSLLDRLTDLEPEVKREARAHLWADMRELRASLARDLAVLLNTRRAEAEFETEFAEAANSVLTLGVADFTSYNLKNAIDQERVRRSIERAIRLFEPRLGRVEVTLEAPDPLIPMLRFQVSAFLRADDSGEPVVFDAALDRASRRIAVSGAGA